ncbi:isoleucine--tRNA ligase [Patescibacteria group bacterium]|nr:isoleucine--tRNA ligase [Patescibacteria group bacterium]
MSKTARNLDFAKTPNFPQLEEEIANYWDADNTFRKSVEQRPADKAYVFYDGPPFATGLPHYGHILASTTKDVIPRYWTMKGYRVERVWGWDCHGLPIENMIEGELELKGGKKGIEKFGIANFNAACRAAILRFDKDWEVIIRRIGRWVDFKNSYKTMDKNYMESVWWGFSKLCENDHVYQGRKVVLYCPRCATPLSNFEIAMDNSYKDVEDNSVYVKFKRKDTTDEYFLAWTTTPWTLPGNVGLAVLPDAEYSLFAVGNQKYWVAKEKVAELAKMQQIHHPEVLKTVKGSELDGLEYEPLFTYMPLDGKKAHYVMTADFVSLEDGTGIVHTAAIYGEDDYALAQKKELPCVPTLDDEGKFFEFVTPVAGMFYKKAEQILIDDLAHRGLVYKAEKYTHSYPFCYRCGTPLYYNAVPAWFINVQQLKQRLIETNQDINWFPDYLKHGRFGKGLETAPDWNISRSRYWGTPMPVWQAPTEKGKLSSTYRVIGSLAELKKWAVDPSQVDALTDIHREFLDDIEVWVDDAKTVKGKRIFEVFDCWVESGSMPFAAVHYPFENKEWFDKNYPAQFISEYIAQTRAWFYCMHVLSVGMFDAPAFQNALTTGTILAEDGAKMSKSKKNYPDPMLLINKYGVDSLRLYLMSSVVMKGDNLNFSEKDVNELRKKVFVIWWNVFGFYQTFVAPQLEKAGVSIAELPKNVDHVMDRWMISRLQSVVERVTTDMDNYDVVRSSRTLMEFVDELSTWYLRQSRERLKETDANGLQAGQVFGYVLATLAKLFAPLTPFFSELTYQELFGDQESVHLTAWPTLPDSLRDEQLEKDMAVARQVVEAAHAQRKEKSIKVRQPLASVTVTSPQAELQSSVQEVVLAEINVKTMQWQKAEQFAVELDTQLTPELEVEGKARELMRSIQQLRKEAGVNVMDFVTVEAPEWPVEWEDRIKQKTKLHALVKGPTLRVRLES